MRPPRPGIGSEILPVALILLGLAGSLGLVMTMYRRVAAVHLAVAEAPAPAPIPPVPPPAEKPAPPAVTASVEPPALPETPGLPPLPPEDPTKPIIGRLGAEEEKQRQAAAEADRQAEALAAAEKAAKAEAERWRRREAMVMSQIRELDDQAERLEVEDAKLSRQRDVLAKELDVAKAAVAKAKARAGGYAVLPHKSSNGTWQRPVMIECRDGMAILQPRGLQFNILEMSSMVAMRSSPLVLAVAREMMRVQDATSPDGSPVVPYIYFIVRPDGIRPYYEARGRLERLGIAFGYELVDRDWDIDFPDFDELTAWDGSGVEKSHGSAAGPTELARGRDFVWPADRPNAGSGGLGDSVWPTQQPGGDGSSEDGLAEGLLPDLRRNGGLGGDGQKPGSATGGRGGSTLRGMSQPGGPSVGSFGDLGRRAGTPGDGATAGRRGAGGARGAGGNPAGGGLTSLPPDNLPGLESPGRGRPGTSLASRDGARAGGSGGPRPGSASSLPLESADGLPLLPLPEGGAAGSKPGSGRVMIDKEALAEEREQAEVWDRFPSSGALNPDQDSAPMGRAGKPPTVPGLSGLASLTPGRANPAGAGQPGGQVPADGAQAPNGVAPPSGIPAIGSMMPSSRGPSQGGDSRPSARGGSGLNALPSNPKIIQVPLDLVVACGRDGVTIHPGGYRLSRQVLSRKGLLKHDLETIVRNYELIDTTVRPVPRIQFLIEPGGADTYELARRQTVLSGLDWPVTFKVAESTAPRVFAKERF